ncbi:MAG: metallophosphoesterase [Thermomicrobiales bacterium]|nr:metallophosphoesterase [Thermomicrobiales bacterium]MCO5222846.1 metallophosphoesterase [Thermomicrobiales bacterium]
MSRRGRRAIGLLAALGGLLAYWRVRHVNPYRPVLERVELPLPAGATALDGLRIAFVTDTHCGPFTTPADIHRGVALFDRERIDLVLLGGDYVSESNLYAAPMADVLRSLVERAPLGAFAVMGNHDLPLGVDRVRGELERIGVRVLRNEHAIVERNGQRLAIAGIDDTIVGRADADMTFASIPAGVPTLALWHEADFAEHAARLGAFAQLSGHTHGGQVRLPFVGSIWLPPDGRVRDIGLEDVEGMPVYISRGLGVYRPPVRFLAPPEVTLVRLNAGMLHPGIA